VRSRFRPVPRRRGAASFRSALTGSDAYFATSPVALAALDEALGDWQREIAAGGAVRACFRLVEPDETADEEAATWRVDAWTGQGRLRAVRWGRPPRRPAGQPPAPLASPADGRSGPTGSG